MTQHDDSAWWLTLKFDVLSLCNGPSNIVPWWFASIKRARVTVARGRRSPRARAGRVGGIASTRSASERVEFAQCGGCAHGGAHRPVVQRHARVRATHQVPCTRACNLLAGGRDILWCSHAGPAAALSCMTCGILTNMQLKEGSCVCIHSAVFLYTHAGTAMLIRTMPFIVGGGDKVRMLKCQHSIRAMFGVQLPCKTCLLLFSYTNV